MKTSACMMMMMMMMIMVLITTAVGMKETEKETGEKAMADMEIIERRSWGMRKVAEDGGGVLHYGRMSSTSGVEYENEKDEKRMINGDEKNNNNNNKGVESCMMSQEHCEKKKAACIKACIHEHPGIQKESVAVKCSLKCKKCVPEC